MTDAEEANELTTERGILEHYIYIYTSLDRQGPGVLDWNKTGKALAI